MWKSRILRREQRVAFEAEDETRAKAVTDTEAKIKRNDEARYKAMSRCREKEHEVRQRQIQKIH